MSHPPPIMTGQQLADFGQWLLQLNLASSLIYLDRRGIQYLEPNKHELVGLGLPPLEEAISDGKIYLRAVF